MFCFILYGPKERNELSNKGFFNPTSTFNNILKLLHVLFPFVPPASFFHFIFFCCLLQFMPLLLCVKLVMYFFNVFLQVPVLSPLQNQPALISLSLQGSLLFLIVAFFSSLFPISFLFSTLLRLPFFPPLCYISLLR